MAKYEININLNGDIAEGQTEEQKREGDAAKVSKATKHLGKYVAAQTIQPFIQQATNYLVSNVQLTTGSSQLQEKVNFGMQVMNMGVNAYKNAQAGATLTMAMGLGGAAGIGIGLALSAVSFGMDTMFKQAQINLRNNEESSQRAYLVNRAGTAFNMSRRGNV